MEVALEHARRDGNTLVVSVSDHETGGLTLGRDIHKEDEVDGVYAWHPEVLHRIEGSHGAMFDAITDRYEELPDKATATDSVDTIAAVLKDMAGIDDLTEAEQVSIQNSLDSYGLNYTVSDIIERRAVIGWTTRGHTAVDVNLYAYGPGVENFHGNMDNTEVGNILASLLNLDLDALTVDLREEAEEAQESKDAKARTTSGPSSDSE